ncbi:MAG: TlpA family protein disulfide reductase [Burkholderiaceae bacterium]
MARRRAAKFLAVAAIAVAAGVIAGWYQFRVIPADDLIVEQLFRQKYPDATGNPTDLSSYRGKLLVINFWATWCAPCIEEMPELSDIQKETTALGVQVLGLAVDTPEKVQEFNKKISVLYPLLVVGSAGVDLSKSFGNESGALPFTVIVDRHGAIVDRTLGRFKRVRLMRVIERILDES